MDKSRTPEISAENRPVSPTASPVASPTASPAASASASASCSASDTAVCSNGSPISNAADNAVNTDKVVKVHKCPICGKLTDNAKYRPFCSKRCADIDLGTWFAEGYVIEGKAPVDEEEGE